MIVEESSDRLALCGKQGAGTLAQLAECLSLMHRSLGPASSATQSCTQWWTAVIPSHSWKQKNHKLKFIFGMISS